MTQTNFSVGSLTTLCWNRALWLNVASHMTSFNQLDYLVSFNQCINLFVTSTPGHTDIESFVKSASAYFSVSLWKTNEWKRVQANSVWPDGKIKTGPIFTNVDQNVAKVVFTYKERFS